MIAFQVPGKPLAFARMRTNGKRHFVPAPQRGYAEMIALHARKAMAGLDMLDGPLRLTVRATYEYPLSWSAKKRAETLWKTSRPDADNILKLAKDSMNGIVYSDDALVAEETVQKKYGPVASLAVSVERIV